MIQSPVLCRTAAPLPALVIALAVWIASDRATLQAMPPESAPLVPPPTPLPPQAQEISPENAATLMATSKNLHILDVRHFEEYMQIGFIHGTIHFDYFHLLPDCGPQLTPLGLDLQTPCLVYCALGERARRAAALMSKAGYQHILVLKGGFNAWKAAGEPVEKEPGAK